MDWSLFHLLNGLVRGHALVEDELGDFTTTWAVPLFAAATLALWFLDRPGRPPRWKLACLTGLAAAALGLLASQPIGWLWPRERPYVAHPHDALLVVPPSQEPSFPSDHAVAAFAIACAVAFFGRKLGALFLAAASTIALVRVVVGLHYPGDVAGGALIGFASALVVLAARRPLRFLAEAGSRATDPLVLPVWIAAERALARRRARRPA